MKKILITGKNSFIGCAVEKYLSKWPEKYQIHTIDMRDNSWRQNEFSSFDVVFHVAGIAHADIRKIPQENENIYRKVNTDLTIEVAKKAKEEGVKQFIFMSSIIIYGDSASLGQSIIINKETPFNPSSCYGESKIRAENGIRLLETNYFKIVILRPPMIYGRNGKGNFPILEKIANITPLFPYVKNERSMLYIGNLVEFVRLIIDNEENGIFWPCNKEYSNTSEVVQLIAKAKGKRILFIYGFEWLIKLLSHFSGLVNKAFGSLSYEKHLGDYIVEYRLYTLEESINEMESKT